MSNDEFNRSGFERFESFLDPEECNQLLARINAYREQNDVPEIYRPAEPRDLRYFVIDGDRIRDSLPQVWEFYHGRALEQARRSSGIDLHPLDDTRVGVNINIMPPNRSEYRWHYDRNAVTGVQYLNEVDGGETEIYPRYRLLLPGAQASDLQRLLDNLINISWLRDRIVTRRLVSPKTGRLLLMQGNRCYHSVKAVRGKMDRINIILAYDRPGADFAMGERLDSYLYTQDDHDGRDPNY